MRLCQLLYFLFPFFKKKYFVGVLVFHRIIPKEKTNDYVAYYDIGQDSRLHEMTLKELNPDFDFIDLDTFINFVTGREKPKKHSMLITFDDADADFMEYALPILVENHWPATVFAPSDYIGSEKRFWHLRISNMIYKMENDYWQIIISNKSIFPDAIQNIIDNYPTYDRSMCFSLFSDFIVYLDGIKDDDIFSIIEQFDNLLGKSYTLGIKCMDWEQLKILEKHGISIESHSATHRKLEHLNGSNVIIELKESKSMIDSKLNKNVKAFCYPAGSFNEKIAQLTQNFEYKVAFTTKSGICKYPLTGIDLFTIPRLSIDGKNKYEINWAMGRMFLRGRGFMMIFFQTGSVPVLELLLVSS